MVFTSIFLAVLTLTSAVPAPQGAAGQTIVTEGVIAAPVSKVWNSLSTNEGWRSMGVAQADVDLKVGGLIRTHYSAEGKLGDEGTIENQILAYDPERMISIKIHRAPKQFPWKTAAEATWTVIYMEPQGTDKTHLTIRMMGYQDNPESQEMKKFFVAGNQHTLEVLKKNLEGKG